MELPVRDWLPRANLIQVHWMFHARRGQSGRNRETRCSHRTVWAILGTIGSTTSNCWTLKSTDSSRPNSPKTNQLRNQQEASSTGRVPLQPCWPSRAQRSSVHQVLHAANTNTEREREIERDRETESETQRDIYIYIYIERER